jgi:hypothetical protein
MQAVVTEKSTLTFQCFGVENLIISTGGSRAENFKALFSLCAQMKRIRSQRAQGGRSRRWIVMLHVDRNLRFAVALGVVCDLLSMCVECALVIQLMLSVCSRRRFLTR